MRSSPNSCEDRFSRDRVEPLPTRVETSERTRSWTFNEVGYCDIRRLFNKLVMGNETFSRLAKHETNQDFALQDCSTVSLHRHRATIHQQNCQMSQSYSSLPPDPLRTLDPVPPAAEPFMASYRRGRSLIVLNGASIPREYCIKSGRPVVKTLEISLRNPANPMTWFGKHFRLEVGLSQKHLDNHRVAVALTWSVLSIGTLLTITGVVTLSPITAVVGLLAMAVSGLFRALSPVTSRSTSADYLVVEGVGESFLEHLSESPAV